MTMGNLNKKRAWNGQATLLTGGGASGGPVVNAGQADFTAEPGYYTVEFNIARFPVDTVNAPGPSNVSGVFRCLTILSWNVEGNQVTRQYSVGGNGSSVSGLGQGVVVSLQDFTDVFNPTNLDYEVSFNIAKGVRPFTNNPPALFGITTTVILAAGSLSLAVPQNVGIISVEVAVSTNPAAPHTPNVVVAHINPGGTLKTYDPQKNTGFVALAPNAQTVRVFNADAANPVDATITWGVDG